MKQEIEAVKNEQDRKMESLAREIAELRATIHNRDTTIQNHKDDYNWERRTRDRIKLRPDLTIVKQGAKINRLAIDALLDQKEGYGGKISEDDIEELEIMKRSPSESYDDDIDYYL